MNGEETEAPGPSASRHPLLAYKWRALAVGSLYLFGGAIEIQTWPTLLPNIARDMDVPASEVAWLVVSFALGMAGSVLTLGHLGDLIGRKRLVIIGLVLDAGFLGVVASSPVLWLMFPLRFFQGMAHAMVLSNINALVQSNFDASERGRALGYSGAFGPIGVLLGPLYGGFIAEWLGWRAALFGACLIILVLLLVVRFGLHGDQNRELSVRSAIRSLDWQGALALLGSIVAVIVATRLISRADTRMLGIGLLPVAALGVALVIWREKRAEHPVLNLRLFAERTFATASAGLVWFSVVVGSNTFLFPFYMQRGLGWSVAVSGRTQALGSLLQPFVNPISGILTDRIGARRIQTAGIVIAGVGLFMASRLGGSPDTWHIVGVLMLIGVGGGMFNPPNNRIIYNSAPRDALGMAAAITASGRYIGQSMGAALAAAMLAAQPDKGVDDAFSTAMFLMTVLLLAGMALIAFTPRLAATGRALLTRRPASGATP